MFDLNIVLRSDISKCLYEQIYEYVRQEIREGKLLCEERLPSTRSLADFLQVSRSTVELAYEQLLSEGYIEARPYRGYFVCKLEELYQLPQATEEAVTLPHREEKKEYFVDFSPTAIDMSEFPFSVWKKINKNILSDSNSRLFSSGSAQGDYSLRETISRYLHSSRGVNCEPEQIVVGAGNDYLLMLLEKILGRHIPTAMENPTYKRAYQIFRSFAYPVKTVSMDENGMIVGQIEKDVKLVYVMPSRQYPTGTIMSVGRRSELLKWAGAEEDRYIIEDDYDSEFRYKGKPIPSLQAMDKHGKVIYMGTFSKAIAPAIRVSYMVLPKSLLRKYKEECAFYSTTVSRIDQKILEEFIKGGYFERYLNKMRKHYRGKHDLLLEELEPFRKNFEITGENAGLHILLTAKGSGMEKELIHSAENEGIKVYGLSESSIEGEADRKTIILGYGGLTEEEIIQGMERLKKAWLT
ncbi:MAG: PLP-dependent aminotransferase family protein [Lachnospiraceae bacterium]|nr:PLP-dependent aminotransferase family protein [Lachnospiraceae bacterium]